MLELKGRTTLALLHFQKDICKPAGRLAPDDADALDRYAAAVQSTKGLLDVARKVGVPVVHSAFGRKRDDILQTAMGGC